MNFGFDGHAGAQPIEVSLIWIELYPHGQPLNDLDVVAGRILGRKKARSIAGRGGHVLDLTFEGLVQRIHLDVYALADMHLAKLCFLEVCGRPHTGRLNDHDELLALRNSGTYFRAALAGDPVDRGDDMAVA